MHVPAGIDNGPQSLDDDAVTHVAVRVTRQGVHHGEDRSPPADEDPVLRTHDAQKVLCGADAHLACDHRLVLVVGGFHDHRLPQPEAFLQLPLQIVVDAHERLHHDAHDALFQRRIHRRWIFWRERRRRWAMAACVSPDSW